MMRILLTSLLLVLSQQVMSIDCALGRNDEFVHNCSYYNNDPFRKPQYKTPLALPDSWPINIPRNPMDRSPKTSKTRVVTLGTGMPSPNPYRSGPSHALVVDGFPYLIDAGEGIWRSISKAVLINGDKLSQAFSPRKLNVLFITHLHQDHTVGLPSLVLNPLNWIYGIRQDIFGPVGTKDMLKYINLAWFVDTDALKEFGIDLHDIYSPSAFNAFANIYIDTDGDGKLNIRPPRSETGDFLEFTAHMDVLVVASACPDDVSPINDYECKAIKFQIFDR